jgi:hypothetical protein
MSFLVTREAMYDIFADTINENLKDIENYLQSVDIQMDRPIKKISLLRCEEQAVV